MAARPIRVLLGDSTPSELPANVLDIVTEVIVCARDVATPYAEIFEQERRRAESVRTTDAIVKELQGFARQTEVGVRATAKAAIRPEVRAHGDEVVESISRLIDGWTRQYERKRDNTGAQVGQRITQCHQNMRQALERFLVPRRHDAPVQRFHRMFDGQRYLDTAVVEPVDGVRIKLALTDPELEVPRRMRSLLGKGNKIQVGTRLSRIRKIEEPVVASVDDLLLVEVERGPGRLRVQLVKKPGMPDVVQIEIARTDDGLLGGRVSRGDAPSVESPLTDRPVLQALWRVLDDERERILSCTAQLTELDLDGQRVEEPQTMLEVAERLVDCHRSTVSTLARHSPNPEEFTIKIETSEGKREEAWIRREELAQHLLGLPNDLRARLGMRELFDGMEEPEIKTSIHHTAVAPFQPVQPIQEVQEDHSIPIEVVSEPMGDGIPELPEGDSMTQDISLEEVIVESGDIDVGCVDDPQVRSR